MKRLLVLSASIAATLFCSISARAVDYTWDNGGSPATFWSVANNYNPDALPGSGDTVTIGNAGNYIVAVAGGVSINLGAGTWTNEAGTNFRIRQGGNSLTASTFTLNGVTGDITFFSRLSNDTGGAAGNGDLVFTVNGTTVVSGSDVRFNNSSTSNVGNDGLVLSSTNTTFASSSGISIIGTDPVRLDTVNTFTGNNNVLSLNQDAGIIFTLSGTTNYSTLGLNVNTGNYNVFQNNTVGSLTVTGFGTVAPGTYTATQLNNTTGTTKFTDGGGTLTIVPEPTTFAMLLGGVGVLALLRRRSRH